MEVTLTGAAVQLVLFLSILFLYCALDVGRIKYAVLEKHPEHTQQDDGEEDGEEEEEEDEEDLISEPIDISVSDELGIDSIKKEIESTCNFATASEGLVALDNPSEITDRLQTGFDMWEHKTGKKGMTYSELRGMFG
jgi:hypothetical protein